jgi:hypothetical protein
MLTFFRRIRKGLLGDGNASKYLLYATGEILLVMVGILLALQVNNWNEERNARNREVTLLTELNSNLLINCNRLKSDISQEKSYFKSAQIIVSHLDNRLPYHDSLAIHFDLSQYSADVVLVNSAYETIKSIGFDLISNDSLRSAIIDLFDSNYQTMVRNTRELEDQFWPSIALPLTIKNLRLVSMDHDFQGAIPINYQHLLDDQTYRSMLERRGVFRRQAASQKEESLYQTKKLIERIRRELNDHK